MVTWITGNSGAGKTTLAKKLITVDGGILLDGDEMRKCWDLGFTKEDRIENNLRIAKIAKMLDAQSVDVVVSTICPYIDLRATVKEITNCRFIYLDGGKTGEEYPYDVFNPVYPEKPL
jgi:adenylylsulfate kinase-like enzyme